MSVTTKRYASFELSGAAVTGLTPTITIKDTRKDEVIVSSATMTEDADISGTYYYQFSGNEGHEFVQRIDAGTDSVDNRYQTAVFTLADEDALAKSHLVTKGQNTSSVQFTKEQLDTLSKALIDSMPESPDVEGLIEKKMDEKVLKVEMPNLELLSTGLSEVKEALDSAVVELKKTHQENNDRGFEVVSDAVLGATSKLEGSISRMEALSSSNENITETLKVFMDKVVEDLVSQLTEFFAGLEMRKQRALGNGKLEVTMHDAFEEFKSLKKSK